MFRDVSAYLASCFWAFALGWIPSWRVWQAVPSCSWFRRLWRISVEPHFPSNRSLADMTLPSKTIKTQWFRNSHSKQLHRSHETAQCQSCLRKKNLAIIKGNLIVNLNSVPRNFENVIITTSPHHNITATTHHCNNTSPKQYITTTIHHNNTSPQQYITTTQQYITATIHHCNNTSPQQYITTATHHNNTSPQQYITTAIHHCNSTSPPQYITTGLHHNNTSPQQYITTTKHHHNNTSLQQDITTTIHHHSSTSPHHNITTTTHHHSSTSPQQYITTTKHHHNNTSLQQYIATAIHHNRNTSQQYITTSIHHHNKTSPQQYITATIHRHNNTWPQRYITTTMHHHNNTSPHHYCELQGCDCARLWVQIVVEWLRPGDALKLGIARNLLSSGQKCSMSTRSVSSFLVCIRMVWRVQTHVQQQSFVMHHARPGLSTRSPDLLVPLVHLRSRRLSGQQPICRLCHSDGTDGLVLVLLTD